MVVAPVLGSAEMVELAARSERAGRVAGWREAAFEAEGRAEVCNCPQAAARHRAKAARYLGLAAEIASDGEGRS